MHRIPHRDPISRRHPRRPAAPQPLASQGAAAPTSPHSSTGTARDGARLPRSLAAPVLIHHPPTASPDEGDDATTGVLLLDGPPGTAFMWHRVLPVLRCCGLQPGTVKRPGYPEVVGPAEDPFGAAADIAQVLADHQHPPVVLVGHGLDTGVALALAATAPSHVRALVLVGPAGGLAPLSIVDRWLAAPVVGPVVSWLGFRVAGLALHLPALRRRVLITQAGVDAREAKALVREITFGTMWRTFAGQHRRLVSDARGRNQQLAGIDCPVLIIAGNADPSAARRCDRALRRLLPGADVIAADATGHQIPIEDPDCVVDAVLLALRREYRTALSTRPRTEQPRPTPA